MTSEEHKSSDGYLKVVDLREAKAIMFEIENISSETLEQSRQELQKELKRKYAKYSKK